MAVDADIAVGDAFRAVQFTPLHSPCSIPFGKGLTTGGPGPVQADAGGRRHRGGAGRSARPGHRGQRGVPLREGRATAATGVSRSGPDPNMAAPIHLRLVQRPRRQRLAAAGDHRPAPRPGMGGRHGGRRRPGRSAARDGRPITAHSRRSPRRTTGGTGTRRTCSRAKPGALRTRPPRPPGATWPRSSTSSSRPPDALAERAITGRRCTRPVR